MNVCRTPIDVVNAETIMGATMLQLAVNNHGQCDLAKALGLSVSMCG